MHYLIVYHEYRHRNFSETITNLKIIMFLFVAALYVWRFQSLTIIFTYYNNVLDTVHTQKS